MKSRIKFEISSIEELEKAHPDCVVTETRKVIDRSKLYAKIKAAQILGLEVPGVRILAEE